MSDTTSHHIRSGVNRLTDKLHVRPLPAVWVEKILIMVQLTHLIACPWQGAQHEHACRKPITHEFQLGQSHAMAMTAHNNNVTSV